MTLINSIKETWADRDGRTGMLLFGGLVIGLPLVCVVSGGGPKITVKEPQPVAVAAPAPAPAPTPKVRIRSYDPVANAMLTAARNNYNRCRQENGTDVLGYAACEDARQTYEYARSQYAN